MYIDNKHQQRMHSVSSVIIVIDIQWINYRLLKSQFFKTPVPRLIGKLRQTSSHQTSIQHNICHVFHSWTWCWFERQTKTTQNLCFLIISVQPMSSFFFMLTECSGWFFNQVHIHAIYRSNSLQKPWWLSNCSVKVERSLSLSSSSPSEWEQ